MGRLDVTLSRPQRPVAGPHTLKRSGGFTLIELMVVLALVALSISLVALSAQPSASRQLEREGERLALWLESARLQARVQNRPVLVRMTPRGAEIWGLSAPGEARPALSWLYPDTQAQNTDITLLLGPEPILPAQALALGSRLQADAQVWVGTTGVGPWQVRR